MAGGLFCILFKAQDDEAKTVVKTDSTGELFVFDSMTETSS